MQTVNFDQATATPTTIKFVTGGKTYILREATGDAIVRWRNAVIKVTKQHNDGKILLPGEGLADMELLLVSASSRMADKDDNILTTSDGKQVSVPMETIREWPYPVIQWAFNTAKEINRLQEFESIQTLESRIADLQRALDQRRHDEESEKNSSSSGSPGST